MTNFSKISFGMLAFALYFAASATAATQVTVDGDRVTVDKGNSNLTNTIVTEPATIVTEPATIVQTTTAPVIVEERDPRRIEGEITNVEVGHGPNAQGQITVRDLDGRERRIDLKNGMISNYKVGDYVEIYLMADMKEAKEIHTRRTADLEGEILTVDYAQNVVVIRDSRGTNRTVLFRPGLIREHRVGDRVRLFVTDEPVTEPVRLIRVV